MKSRINTLICIMGFACASVYAAQVQVVQEGPALVRLTCPTGADDIRFDRESKAAPLALTLPDAAQTWELGRPLLPVYRICLAVPRGAEVALATSCVAERRIVLESELPPMQPLPSTTGRSVEGYIKDTDLYASDIAYPAARARIVNRGFLRDLEVITVELAPVQYKPKSNTLMVAEGLEVSVQYEAGRNYLQREIEPRQVQTYRAIVSNYSAVESEESEARAMAPARMMTESADPGADILIIAYDSFIPALASLVSWRESQGYLVKVVGISEIYNGESDEDARIELLHGYLSDIMDGTIEWGTRPSFVLLVGDKAEITPAYFLGTYGDTGYTDYYYARVVGDDWYGDLAIGRFSASNSTDVTNQVGKTIYYEQNSQAKTGVAGASGETGGDFEQCEDRKIQFLMKPNGLICQTNYNGRDGSGYNTFIHAFNGTVDPTTGKNFSPGTGIITVDTHGNSSVWGGLLEIGSVNDSTMTNRHYYPISFISACMCGMFQVEDCIMEKLQTIQGGTVANTGSATLACGGTSDQLLNIALQGIMGVDPPYHPDRFEYTISPNIGYVPILGQAMSIAGNEYLIYYGNPNGWNVKECMMQYNLFGDPALVTGFLPATWPMFHADLQHTGRSNSYSGPLVPGLAWSYTAAGMVESSPVLGADGTPDGGRDAKRL